MVRIVATYALVKDGIIDNVILADESRRATYEIQGYIFIEIPVVPGSPGIGWTYDGVTFSPPVGDA